MKYTEAIRSYMQSSAETWDVFAKRAGVGRATLYKVLSGCHTPRLDTAEKLLAAAGYALTVTAVGQKTETRPAPSAGGGASTKTPPL